MAQALLYLDEEDVEFVSEEYRELVLDKRVNLGSRIFRAVLTFPVKEIFTLNKVEASLIDFAIRAYPKNDDEKLRFCRAILQSIQPKLI